MTMRFAESAQEAWTPPLGLRGRTRAFARRQVLSFTRMTSKPSQADFIRCLYSHAIFPEAKDHLRTFIRTLKSQADFIDTPTLVEMMASKQPVRGRYYHLSFDDGFANVVETGGDVFASEKVPYTLFVSTDLIGASIEQMERYNETQLLYALPVRTLTWDQLRACGAAGGEVGCHTRTHARLSAISGDDARLRDEIVAAKARIEAEIGTPCRSFAWPYGKMGDIDAKALAAIEEAGFDITFSAVRGRVGPGAGAGMKVPRHQVEFHWPLWENLLWAGGCRE